MRRISIGLVAAAAMATMALSTAPGALATGQATMSKKQTDAKDFEAANFSARSTTVNNKFLPLVPGSQYVYDGTANRGSGSGAHEVVFTVTDVTKWIDNVRAVAIWDRDYQDGELVEEELAFMAQDNAGNVWSLGEYPEEHDEDTGEISAPSTWLAGKDGATAGLLMRANPQVGTSRYTQGSSPNIEFLDYAKVFATGQKTCVPTGCYTGVLVVDEWNPLDQPADGHQFKHHAPGVGVVQIVGKGGEEQETLVLTKFRHLGDDDRAAASKRALELDTRAYSLADPDVYRHSAFAHLR